MKRPLKRYPAALTLLIALVAALWRFFSAPPALDASPLADCLGTAAPMTVIRQMPYVRVAVNGSRAQFVIDFGADVSAITPAGFGASRPQPMAGTADRYADFDFFGRWRNVRLQAQPVAPVVGGMTQAGVIGTDFLSRHIYTLDYPHGRVFRAAAGAFCADRRLHDAGFVALDTRAYYAATPGALSCPRAGAGRHCPNIPALPIRLGTVTAVAQVDTGFDDAAIRHSININTALFNALQRAGVALVPRPDIALTLSTCQRGVTERVTAWQLPAGAALEFVGASGQPVRRFADATLFVKQPPAAARVCGGIGTWPQPAAQLGASFFADGALVVDPYSARVWLR